MPQSFVVRRYKEGDEKSILELMRLCLGRVDYDYWMKHWAWEYEQNPLGKYIWIVEHNGQIVAHSSRIPINLKVGKKIFKSCIGADAMTHPAFQRRRLQRKMGDIARDELVKAGIYFSYYFPSEIFHKHPGERSYAICKFPFLMKFLDTNEVLKRLVHSKSLAKFLSVWLNPIISTFFGSKNQPYIKDVRITRIAQFDDRIDVFWKDISRYFGIIVVKNKEHLNWRYFQRPHSNFKVLLAEDDEKILGYVVFTSRDETGFIVDLLVYPQRLDVIQSLVSIVVEQLREEKIHWIICRMLKNNPYYRILRGNGFITYSPKYLFGVTIYSPSNCPEEFLKNPNNWHLTLGDTDGVEMTQL